MMISIFRIGPNDNLSDLHKYMQKNKVKDNKPEEIGPFQDLDQPQDNQIFPSTYQPPQEPCTRLIFDPHPWNFI